MRALRAHAVAETRLTLRRGESLLLTVAIPVGLLVFGSLTKVLPRPSDQAGFLVPGILALAIMSTGMVSLGIATAFEREYKVLKRLGTTPLGRPRLVGAKVLSVVFVEVLQAVVVLGTGLVLGWGPARATSGCGQFAMFLAALGAAIAATSAFAGLGLLMAGRLRADIVLAVANGLWLVLMLLGGMLFPLSKLPSGLRAVADVLPASALSEALRGAIGTGAGVPGHAWAVLGIWAVAAPVAAGLSFRWE
jgi:ABC-2 type transport system permease protein